jgi:N-acetylmuramoyl-L-alanine amidase
VTALGLLVAGIAPATAASSAPRGIGDLVAATDRAAPTGAGKATAAADPAAPGLVLSGWSVGGDEARTVVTVDLSEASSLRIFALAEPTRVIIDLPSARFEPATSGARAGRGLVTAWRFGAHAAGRSRLVIETRGPVRLARADFDTAAPAGRARLVIELLPGTVAAMREIGAIELEPAGTTVAKAEPVAAVEPVSSPIDRPVVVIDAGHGGGDAGTVSPATGTPEKTVVLQMARVLAERLRETGRYEVVMTRDEDVFLGLGERVRIARARKADLFLSVHADAEYDHSVRGATIYTVAEKASDEQAAALAAKENQSDALAGHVVEEAEDEVADILADLTLRETRRLSHAFARDLLDEYRRHGRLVKSQPHRQAGLKVLRAHDIPSALVELGFLSNKEDEALLTSPEWREKTAQSLIAAIDRWFAGRDVLAAPGRTGTARAPASP